MRTAIIGAGNMGGSIARGLARGTILQAADIIVSNPSQGKLDALQAENRMLRAELEKKDTPAEEQN